MGKDSNAVCQSLKRRHRLFHLFYAAKGKRIEVRKEWWWCGGRKTDLETAADGQCLPSIDRRSLNGRKTGFEEVARW
jgi:hypothetical protein